jgi:glycosyltransferase involved in cell wall biosynthesis
MKALTKPPISVVIPSYKHAHLIGRTLQSVLDQTYTNWEVIVVDNHSPDQTEQVVQEFSDPRIKLLKIHNNGVIAASRNMGIREAKGEWIAFVDSDDWWTSNKLQECVAHMTEDIDLIYHELEIVREKFSVFGLRKIKSRQLNEPALIDLLVNGNAIANSSVVVRKDALLEIGGLSEDAALVACEDYYAWLKIAERKRCFLYLPKRLGYYYLNKQGVSNKDMSIPARHSVSEFLHLLTVEQKEKMESGFRYASGSNFFKCKDYESARSDLFFVLRHGQWLIKLKAIALLVMSVRVGFCKTFNTLK